IGVVAVLVADIFVAGPRPGAVEGAEALGAVVPVGDGAGRAADQQFADFARRHVFPVLADDAQVVTRHGAAGGAVADVARTVGQEDVQHLGRADAVQNVDAEQRLPALADFLRQGFAGRNAGAQAVRAALLRDALGEIGRAHV